MSAFKHRISVQFIEQQSPLGIKTFSQGIYTKQLTFGVFKNHWNLRYVNPSFYEETGFLFRQHSKPDFAKPYFTLKFGVFKNKSRKHHDTSPVCQVIFRDLSLKINSSYNEEETKTQCWPRAVVLKRIYCILSILIWSLRPGTALD